ncbi:MAG: hypothetical protein JGK17_22135 [Microcoleus sp. PH2017_10_PVI_O_A]|uniref:hypothetical protein n=1 Tax=unclassified Microcoleus TaxID=2642155 RepID=UPI001DAC792E|nr:MULTISPECIES: hypothetical protein [unclassified Microcoleus]MCC3408237.1 hypothetical protein [Microcoleus sp. PH2017_10_PVI_O_A]MCC3462331.1 hypothetical protein [Microcoleus sp. PH2017_11_PCY_U_A]MCC3480782.1 hypothetical protein [Microcoleus sp. PH2017_12_PCY_D_A]MCC3530709.1 hypothetical protein [Microcoleus sp. PH2017_21_RUC_O_A]MCC3543078.1 hypothetical protein [Microcoleus sp. PH2017_22_RUC_O_B]
MRSWVTKITIIKFVVRTLVRRILRTKVRTTNKFVVRTLVRRILRTKVHTTNRLDRW